MPNSRSSIAKDRLLETARKLFLRDGVPQTGINSVTAQADVARMTLYNNFASKDDLVLAVFTAEMQLRRQIIQSAQDAADDPVDKVLALFDVSLDIASQKDFRGCAFINLSIETAAPDSALHQLAKAHKDWVRQNITTHLRDAGFAAPEDLAGQISVLWDGASVGAYIHQSTAPIRMARDAARTLIAAAS